MTMKWFYVRWAGVLLVAFILILLNIRHYENDLKNISPEQLLAHPPTQMVRVIGRVQGGSLMYNPISHEAMFAFTGEREKIDVQYRGEAPENLRELKTLVITGQWDPSIPRFEAHNISLVPNYGFVASAYLIGIIPAGLFLFGMERKVALLYNRIKSTKPYKPEESSIEQE